LFRATAHSATSSASVCRTQPGIKFNYLQYKGSPAIITDLIGKNNDIAMDSIAAYIPTVKSG
jgi:tripartite-type tricarboxylate transporter receptor subunit TctC